MRRWFQAVLVMALLFAIAVVTMPWWLGAAARPWLARHGFTLLNVQADGWRGMRFDEIQFVRGNTNVVARNVRIPAPILWLRPASRHASADTWSVVVRPSDAKPAEPRAVNGMPALHDRLKKIAAPLQRWLARATVGPGEVRWPRGVLTLAEANWTGGILTGRQVSYWGQTFDLTIDASPADLLVVAARQPAREAAARLEWRGHAVTGTGTWWGQPAQIDGSFPAEGWLPRTANISAENWILPAGRVGLGAHYSQLTGAGSLSWQGQDFLASLVARAEPRAGVEAPAFEVRLGARGDAQAITIAELKIDAPFAQANLSGPVTFTRRGELQGNPAHFSIEVDLAKQPWVEATGRLSGSLTTASTARQDFAFTLNDARLSGIAIQQAAARGHWQWPRLAISSLEVQLDSSSSARLAGTIDWERRELSDVSVDATVSSASLSRWLPARLAWETGTVKATLNGPLSTFRHAGEVRLVQAKAGPLKPFDLVGSWQGSGRALENFSAELIAQESRLQIKGHADVDGLSLTELIFAPAGIEQLALAGPARVLWSPTIRVPAARLQGPTASLDVAFAAGPAGSFRAIGAHLDKEWVHDWLDLRGPTWRVRHLEATGRVVDQAWHYSADLEGEVHLPKREISQVKLSASGDHEGLKLSNLTIAESGRTVTQATGQIALSWLSDGTTRLRVDRKAPLALRATIESDSPLWAALGEPMGINATKASAEALLQGTLDEPHGELRLNVAKLEVAEGSRWREDIPDVSDLELVAGADRAEMRVDSFQARIEGQELRGHARLPMADGQWRQLVSEPAKFNWHAAEALVEIPGADLAAFARRFPGFVGARGQLRAHVELARGGNLSGSLHLAGVATRPLPALGVVQEITASIGFAGRSARIESFTGMLGGEPVQLQGSVELPAGAAPQLDLQLTGRNLPLVRRAGLLVRSDVALHAKTEGERTRISGRLNLRDGLVLSDFSDLLPTGIRGARRLPPYFSVAADPFRRWGLAVELRGPSALRVRTPFFTGTASAHFDLSGNLGEPRAVGEITIEEGRMFFPFATFNVQNGAIRLRAADPFRPELALNAVSRRRNYELRLEASGSPEAPVLAFSSNPALEASQVLLMVMAGQMPADQASGTPGQGGLRLTQLGAYLGQGIYRGLGGSDENRLEIVSGERVSRQGRETYEVEYKLGERWSLVGEYDEFDSYNGGIKWRVYSKEGSGEKN
jgi:translocation and assembly module TamB